MRVREHARHFNIQQKICSLQKLPSQNSTSNHVRKARRKDAISTGIEEGIFISLVGAGGRAIWVLVLLSPTRGWRLPTLARPRAKYKTGIEFTSHLRDMLVDFRAMLNGSFAIHRQPQVSMSLKIGRQSPVCPPQNLPPSLRRRPKQLSSCDNPPSHARAPMHSLVSLSLPHQFA